MEFKFTPTETLQAGTEYRITITPSDIPDSVEAKSGKAVDIKAAIEKAVSLGVYTVLIPSGVFELGGNLTVPMRIKLFGQGVGHTIIESSKDWSISFSSLCRISNFSLVNHNEDGGMAFIGEYCKDFRLDNLEILGFGAGYVTCAVYLNKLCSGVIDHNHIVGVKGSDGYGIAYYGDGQWPYPEPENRYMFYRDLAKYQAQALFMEDNLIEDTRHAIASNNGTYTVFRHNRITGGHPRTSNRIDAHGPNKWHNGSRFYEFYENDIDAPPDGLLNEMAIEPRGGDGVIYNNRVKGYKYAVGLSLEAGQKNEYPQEHQIHRTYVWGNTGYTSKEVVVTDWVQSDKAIMLGRDFWNKPPEKGYTPYPYPHPLTQS